METNLLNPQIDCPVSPSHKLYPGLSRHSIAENYFGLKEKPFKLSPDPKYLFMSNQHQEALGHLVFGIQENKGFVVIFGEVGTGKTILCRSFLSHLENNIKAAYIFNPCLTDVELLQNINDEFSIPSNSESKKCLIDGLNKYLLEEKRQGNKVILIIDEAQNLTPLVLEQLRLLSNLETDTEKLILIILVGQPELGNILSRSDMRQLKQRITVDWELLPLNKSETSSYIKHRVKIAGGNGKLCFANGAISRIYKYSKGLPRLINVLSDRALIIAFAMGKKQITSKIIHFAIKDIEKNRHKSLYPNRLVKASFVLAFLLLALLSWRVLIYPPPNTPPIEIKPETPKIDGPPTSSIVKVAPLPETPPVLNTIKEFDAFLEQTGDQSRVHSIEGILKLWDLEPLSVDELNQVKLSELKEKRGLSFFETYANLMRLKLLNYPAILLFQTILSPKPIFLLLVEIHNDYLVFLSKGEKIRVSPQIIKKVWLGQALILWKNFDNIEPNLIEGWSGYEVAWLSKKLKELGYYENDIIDVFDNNLKNAVMRFQKDNLLEIDGVVGKETKIVVYNKMRNHKTPPLVYE